MIRFFIFGILWGGGVFAKEPIPPFRVALGAEPQILDPALQKTSASNFLLNNLHRSLFRIDEYNRLVPELADGPCQRKKTHLKCRLKKNLHWSDGSPLVAMDFIRTFQRLLSAKTKAPRSDVLFPLVNAQKVLLGEGPASRLSAQATDDSTLEFDLSENETEFEWNLAALMTAPTPSSGAPTKNGPFSGPYKIKNWQDGKFVLLEKNPFFLGGQDSRPNVEMYFIDEDSTALRLYQQNKIDFIRRLSGLLISKYESTADFHWVNLLRLDFLAFGPRLNDQPLLRKALSLALNYQDLKTLFRSENPPGCWGVPSELLGAKNLKCLESADPASLAKLDFKRNWQPPLEYQFSASGGEDHRRAAELEQSHWKQNLGLLIRIRSVENKLFLSNIKNSSPDIYRKSTPLERPTCLGVLQALDAHLEGANKNCESYLNGLLQENRLIPLGPMRFGILARSTYTGWRINSLNQLDLAQLKFQ